MFRAKPYTNPGPGVTHCITETVMYDGEGFATKRTVKLLLSFAMRAQLTSSGWLTACLQSKQLLDSDAYRVRGIVLGNKVIRFKDAQVNAALFAGRRFSLEQRDTPAITRSKIARIIENCGGAIVEPAKDVPHVSMSEQPVKGATTITYRYVLDSLTFQTALSIDSYLVQ